MSLVEVVKALLQKQTVVLTMALRLISVIVLINVTPKQDQINYLLYGMTRCLGLNKPLFTMRVSLRNQLAAGQPGMRVALALRHVLTFMLRSRNVPGPHLFITYQNR